MARAVFLDRDGVLNALVYRPKDGTYDSPYSLDEFQLLPRVAEAIKRIHRMDMLAVVISNQPGVAKGKCDRSFLQTLSEELQSRLGAEGARLDAIYYCLHHPEAIVEELRVRCDCRKPQPGLLVRAADELGLDLRHCYMVGDTERDVGAAVAAGCVALLVGGDSAGCSISPQPDAVAPDVLGAIEEIERKERYEGSEIRV